ncbi:MAG: 2,3-bisphosphoglycerate-independent phosphoglycerate mutase, partial [Parcubacteria group bacterium GW2011_GWA2_56_7]
MEEVHPINVVVMESHVFLSERHRKMLFGDTPMHINRPRPYMQGQFIYEDRVSVSTPSGTLPSVSVFGPAYPVTSVELTESDAKRLGISDVPRESGDVRFSASCILKGPFGVVDAAESVLIPKPFLCLSNTCITRYNAYNILNPMAKPLVLIIRDGWGVAPPGPGNAVALSRTPHHDELRKKYSCALLEASGEAIGLPRGFHGNSEVGHLTMGAGRPVKQELTFIHEEIASGAFLHNKKIIEVFTACRDKGKILHLIGILQDAGVHAHEEHLWALLTLAQQQRVERVIIHALADGRDSPPRSVLAFLKKLSARFPQVPVGTVAGRYWLDRAGHWPLIETLYRALVFGEALTAKTAEDAVEDAYRNRRTPDGQPMVDEYIPPYRIGNFEKMEADDTVFFFNFRQDRMIQLTRAFVE